MNDPNSFSLDLSTPPRKLAFAAGLLVIALVLFGGGYVVGGVLYDLFGS